MQYLAGDASGSLVGEWDSAFYDGGSANFAQRFRADKLIIQSAQDGAIIGCLALGEKSSSGGSGEFIAVLGNYTRTPPFGSNYSLVVFDIP